MTVDRFKSLVATDFDAVNTLIIERCKSKVDLTSNLSSYIMESGGKRLRPLLVLLSSRACQYQGSEHVTLAAVVEFVHTATLLHDDVVDDSSLRRGTQTANTIWGSKASILVGDFLLTQALAMTAAVKSWSILDLMVDTMDQMSVGEIKQLSNRRNYALSKEDYFEIIRSKTALLFATSSGIGPLLNNCERDLQINLYNYGLHLGNAFQLIDDALDYSADAKTMGKNTGDDLAEGVITMPLLLVLKHGSEEQQTLVKKSLEEGNRDNLPQIIEAIHACKALEATQQLAAEEIDLAITSLNTLPDSIYKEGLIGIAEFALNRSF